MRPQALGSVVAGLALLALSWFVGPQRSLDRHEAESTYERHVATVLDSRHDHQRRSLRSDRVVVRWTEDGLPRGGSLPVDSAYDYEVGDRVEVGVDPDDPSAPLRVLGHGVVTVRQVLTAGVFAIGGAWAIWWGVRRFRR